MVIVLPCYIPMFQIHEWSIYIYIILWICGLGVNLNGLYCLMEIYFRVGLSGSRARHQRGKPNHKPSNSAPNFINTSCNKPSNFHIHKSCNRNTQDLGDQYNPIVIPLKSHQSQIFCWFWLQGVLPTWQPPVFPGGSLWSPGTKQPPAQPQGGRWSQQTYGGWRKTIGPLGFYSVLQGYHGLMRLMGCIPDSARPHRCGNFESDTWLQWLWD